MVSSVEALDPINILVNYWWDPVRQDLGSPWDALLHGIIAYRGLPFDQRRAWKAAFDHYVFLQNGDPGAHLRRKQEVYWVGNRGKISRSSNRICSPILIPKGEPRSAHLDEQRPVAGENANVDISHSDALAFVLSLIDAGIA